MLSGFYTALGYPQLWADLNLVQESALREQFTAFEADGYRHSEHYRYGSLKRLVAESAMTDEFVSQFVRLAELDSDRVMATSAVLDLLSTPRLTDEQFLVVSRMPWIRIDGRAVRRIELLRRLGHGSLTDDVVEACVQSSDGVVQAALLAFDDLSSAAVVALMERGANRRVRNLAKERLRRGRT